MAKAPRKSAKQEEKRPVISQHASADGELTPDKWPTTVEDVVADLLKVLSAKDRETLRNTPREQLARYHFSLGMFIRNRYGLWGGNEKLLKSVAARRGFSPHYFLHPDDASGVIIESLHKALECEPKAGETAVSGKLPTMIDRTQEAFGQGFVIVGSGTAPTAKRSPVAEGHKAVAVRAALHMPEQPPTAAVWDDFAERLATVLAALEEGDYLVVNHKRRNRYLQFMGQGSYGMRAESVSDCYLEESERLTESEHHRLLKMGWKPPTWSSQDRHHSPDGSPNYHMDLARPVQYGMLADVAAMTLRYVHKAIHPGSLEYKAANDSGEIIRFPTLGLRVAAR